MNFRSFWDYAIYNSIPAKFFEVEYILSMMCFKTYDETTSSGTERIMKRRQGGFPKCQNIKFGQNGKNSRSAYSYYFFTKAVRIRAWITHSCKAKPEAKSPWRDCQVKNRFLIWGVYSRLLKLSAYITSVLPPLFWRRRFAKFVLT